MPPALHWSSSNSLSPGLSTILKVLTWSFVVTEVVRSIPHHPSSSTSQLYSSDDPIHLLNATNFESVIFGKNKAWIVEFYNSWCGHCIRFAPTWKEFAKDIQGWRSVVDVAAIDCVDSKNIETCRYYKVTGFPTLKYFWVNVTKKDRGEEAGHNTELQSIRRGLINFLEDNWRLGVPKHWPELRSYLIDEVQEHIKHDKAVLALILEPPKSYVGKEVILDMSSFTDVRIIRVLATASDLPRRAFAKNIEIRSVPALVILKPNNEAELVLEPTSNEDARIEFVTALKKKLFGKNWNKPVLNVSNHGESSDHVKKQPGRKLPEPYTPTVKHIVYMVDLENAVVSSLRNEIGVNDVLNNEGLSSLKSYLRALSKYFPGRPPVVAFLKELYRWVSAKKDHLSITEFLSFMDDIQSKEVFLPEVQPWIGCKGSEDRYRGYPCSLWTLFHTLTVEALWKSQHGKGTNPQHVLLSIRNYVRDFFTCTECSVNFMQMASSIEKELKSTHDGVMWLWNAHNKVNHRLAGDETEDPKHPKVQFPPKNLCPYCWLSTDSDATHWNKTAVFDFLMSFYARANINTMGIQINPPRRMHAKNPNGGNRERVLPAEINRDGKEGIFLKLRKY